MWYILQARLLTYENKIYRRYARLVGFNGTFFTSHIIVAFYSVLYPSATVSSISLDDLATQPLLIKAFVFTPLIIFYNGVFAVMFFLLISGYVVSYNCFHNKDENYITSSFFKRYFRLTIPILFSCIISYFLLKVGAFSNIKASWESNSPQLIRYFACDANFFNMIKFVLYAQYFNFSSFGYLENLVCYNPILWMMPVILLGSFLVYSCCALFARASGRLRILIYIALIIIFSKQLLLAPILGMICADMDANNISQNINKIILYIMLLSGIYLAAFIRYDFPIYTILDIDLMKNYFGDWVSLLYFYYIISAFLLFFVLSRLSFAIKFFTSKVMLYLGKISFSIYLLHFIVICSFSSYVYIWLRESIHTSYNLTFFITSSVTIVITIITAHIFHNYIELKSINWTQSLYNIVSRQK